MNKGIYTCIIIIIIIIINIIVITQFDLWTIQCYNANYKSLTQVTCLTNTSTT